MAGIESSLLTRDRCQRQGAPLLHLAQVDLVVLCALEIAMIGPAIVGAGVLHLSLKNSLHYHQPATESVWKMRSHRDSK
jgi:hypothetical protein